MRDKNVYICLISMKSSDNTETDSKLALEAVHGEPVSLFFLGQEI